MPQETQQKTYKFVTSPMEEFVMSPMGKLTLAPP